MSAAVVAGLLFPSAMPAQAQAHANRLAPNATRREQSPRRVYRAKLNARMASAIRNTPALQGALSVKGSTVRPRAGTALWALANGSYVLVNQSDTDGVLALPSQAIYRNLANGALYFAVCICPFSGGDDSCKFEGGTRKENCKGQMCCGFKEGEVAADGSVRLY